MMQKFFYLLSILLFTAFSFAQAQQTFEINSANDPDLTAESIVEDLCFGPGIEVINVEYAGLQDAVGVFYDAENFVGIDSGFLMTTGLSVTTMGGIQTGADRPSNFVASVNNSSSASYPGLAGLANSSTIEDVAVYSITFVPTQDSILFRYVFASEEYPDFVCSPFNDVFGFFLSGPNAMGIMDTVNLATVPGGTLPVSINSINSGSAGNHFSVLPDQYCQGEFGSLGNAEFFVPTGGYPAYNGYTTVFEAKAVVTPCQTYTMDLVLADAGDALFDSAIFFEANSFCSFGDTRLITSSVDEESPILMEGCEQEPLVFDLSNVGPDAFPIAYRVSGDAVAGEDYEGGVILGSIDTPVEAFEIPIQTIDDGLTEGAELVRIVFQSVECFADTTDLYIIDGLSLLGPSFVNCTDDGIELSLGYPNSGLNPPTDEEVEEWINNLNYTWSTGETTPTITVSPTQTTTYTVEYGNSMNSCSDELTITVGSVESTIAEEICFNEPGIVVNGTVYNLENLSGTEILTGAAFGGCDSIVNIDLTPAALGSLQMQLCDNEAIEVNGTTYDRSNDEGYEILEGAAVDGCDSLLLINLSFIPTASGTYEATLCADEEFILNGTSYNVNNPSGTEIFENASVNGCDSTVNVSLTFYEQSMGIVMETLCQEDSLVINGTTYNFENTFGTEIYENADVNGCDSIVEVLIDFYPRQTSHYAAGIPEGMAYNFGGQTFTATGTYEVPFTDQNGCDSIVLLDILVEMITETIRDSIILNDPVEFCFDTSIFQEVVSVENICEDQGGTTTDFDFNEDDYCLTYTGITPGVDSACFVLCDEFGVCDTTNFIISTFFNLLDAVDDYDTTGFDQTITLDVLANDWTSSTTIIDYYIVDQPSFGTATLNGDNTITFDPNLTACDQEDQFTYAICNETGCDTATVFLFLEDSQDICDAVWPGDVVPDGQVNQADFWAVGLGFNQGPGPVRPNASLDWFAQPAIDWPTTITFIQQFNSKHADTNGDGNLNNGDYAAINQNFGLEHGFSSGTMNFPLRELPNQLGEVQIEEDNWYAVELNLGKTNQAIDDFYGLYFQLDFDPNIIDASSLYMDWEGGWTGQLNDNLDDLQKLNEENGILHIASVRNDQNPAIGGGKVGTLRFRLLDANTTQIDLTCSNMSMVNHQAEIFSLKDINLSTSLLTSTLDFELLEHQLSVFPNPAKDILNVVLPDEIQNWNIKVFNLSGEILLEKTGTEAQLKINASRLTSGVYMLSVQTDSGMINKKFSIQ